MLFLSEHDSLDTMQAKLDLANVRTAYALYPQVNRDMLAAVVKRAYAILGTQPTKGEDDGFFTTDGTRSDG